VSALPGSIYSPLPRRPPPPGNDFSVTLLVLWTIIAVTDRTQTFDGHTVRGCWARCIDKK